MFRILTILLLLALLPGCGPDPQPIDSVREFSYDENSGTCKNSSGATGFNAMDMEKIRSSKDCECMKLSKIEMVDLVTDTILVEERPFFRGLLGYNFRGAVLDSCYIFLYDIIAADLRGANLSTLQYGYSTVVGRIDNFTKPPVIGFVSIDGDSLRCAN